jgi:RimJ/RimL family protein N-acetyltransferase
VSFRIETERLVLDLLRDGDEHRVMCWASDPVATRYMGFRRHESLQSSRAFVLSASEPTLDGPRLDIVVAIRRKSDGLLLGSSGIHQESDVTVQTGYVLDPAFWRQGYATEAVRHVIDWIFSQLPKVTEVTAPVFADNLASQGLARKLGMLPVREERKDLPRGDKDVLLVIFAITREQWTILRSPGA